MQLIFTKGAARHDRMDVVRDGVVTGSVECPKQGIIPHDMVHYAVESALLKRGFVRRVIDGEPASFRMEPEAESDAVERLVEVLQADGWSGWRSDPGELLALYASTCDARQCTPLTLQAGDLAAVRTRILELTEQWLSVPAGKSLTLQVEPDLRRTERP